MMDEAAEFSSKATEELPALLQAKQATPVSYRPILLGLVERVRRNRLAQPHKYIEDYHELLIDDLNKVRELAKEALERKQARKTIYYNQRRVKQKASSMPGQLVWIYLPSTGPRITKFKYIWTS
ncbi:hypothetical protein PC128_g5773 [Phytophthora cactorum]|nr:hypothetical protein PC120_g23426 [Phytophthora cactorum]KAG3198780.1 hypothetical protein PC128_g5773 [Phytophthora cactorum]KAG4063743.1 hypothetical protein PC123_g1396 [Phytophthora cactorum]